MKALGLIIQRECFSRIKTKTFILTTILTPFLFIAVAVLPSIITILSSNDDINKIYILDHTSLYAKLFESSEKYKFINLDSKETNKQQGGDIALLEISEDLSKNPKAVTFFSEKQHPPRELTAYINNVLTEAVRDKKINDFTLKNNIEPTIIEQLQEILKSKDRISISTIRWDETGQETQTLGEIATFVGMGLTLCIFIFMMMYGSLVMQSVVEEKSNRIIEVIISSVKPFDLMMGKIVGVGLVGLLQLLIWSIIGGGFLLVAGLFIGGSVNISPEEVETLSSTYNLPPGMTTSINNIFNINWFQVIICFILYFIGGYLLFASLFAMFGSAANDSQEAQQLIMPVTVLLMVAFYTGFAAARNPEGTMALWCSIIPFTSPIVMMVRTPFEVPIWQLILSIVLLYATAILMIKLAAKIYRTGILMYGKKVTFGEMFKWLKYK